jgi:hypothetical protein
MGHRPLEAETSSERLSRPAELVQRARQLAQLNNVQFGRTGTSPVKPQDMDADADENADVLSGMGGLGASVSVTVSPTSLGTLVAGRVTENVETALEEVQQRLDDVEAELDADEKAEARDRATDQKIRDFYGVKQVGGEVLFACRFERASSVAVAGDFNGWSPERSRMKQGRRQGEWNMVVPLAPGRYRYRLVVDGKWITDPYNQYVEANQFGELNNVFEVDPA